MIPARVLRRVVFLLVFLAALAPALFATGTPEPTPQAPATPAAPATTAPAAKGGNQWHESPMLHDKVVAGQLPALAQRLPKDPFVEKVVEEIGEYGGDWNMTWNGLGAKWGIGSTTEEAMFRFTPDGKAVVPNVAKSVKINDNYTEFTITLREGMKWSDGTPFTADDVLFFWDELLVPGTYSKQVLGYPAFYTIVDGKKVLCKVEKIDASTVKITHAKSFPTFLQRMAIDTKWFFAPAHYYKTILPKFIGQEKALEIAKKHGFGDVTAWLKEVGYYYWQYPERPTLRAWVPMNDATDTRWILQRNPWFWKTDAQGNQLPYIDRIVIDLVEDKLVPMKAIAGELDCQSLSSAEYTLIKENEKKGDYRVINWKSAGTASNTVEVNQTVKDPGLRALFTDQNFRAGLSVAINRNEVNEIVYGGLQVPQQASILEGLPYSSPTWSKKYAEYDPAEAAKFFDAVGLPWDKDHKYRTRPDGSELLMLVHYATNPTNDQVFELVKKYWEVRGHQDRGQAGRALLPGAAAQLERHPGRVVGHAGLRHQAAARRAGAHPDAELLVGHVRPLLRIQRQARREGDRRHRPFAGGHGQDARRDDPGRDGLLGEEDRRAAREEHLDHRHHRRRAHPDRREEQLPQRARGGMYNTDELRYLGIANPVQFFIRGGK